QKILALPINGYGMSLPKVMLQAVLTILASATSTVMVCLILVVRRRAVISFLAVNGSLGGNSPRMANFHGKNIYSLTTNRVLLT
ncbi:MAG: hypothetical protein MKZ76_01580, partial [Pedosphaera sp.]|nr:hypothetical protein [Pedosphaera sp.]